MSGQQRWPQQRWPQQRWLERRWRHLRPWAALALILVAFVAQSLAWSAALPLWQGTDEAAHFGLMQYIAETGRLPGREQRYLSAEILASHELADVSRLPFDPTQRQAFAPDARGPNEAAVAALDPELRTSLDPNATNQVMLVPPLYGIGGALVYRLFYSQDVIVRSFAVRLYAIALGAAVVILAYLLGRELWPAAGVAAPATLALLVAFQPQFMYSAAGGTSDVLAVVWFTALAYLGLRTVRRGATLAGATAMGVCLGLGLLTKPHLFLVGPFLAVLFGYLWLRARSQIAHPVTRSQVVRRVVICALLVAGLGLLFWSAWAVRSIRLHGNPFYDTLWASGWAEVTDPQYEYPLLPYLADYARSLVGGLLASYWGLVGYLDTSLPPQIYWLLLGLTLLSIAGLGWLGWRSLRARQAASAQASPLRRDWVPYVLLSILALTPVLYFAWFNYGIWRRVGIGWPLMGRHLAGPLAAQMALWMWGLLAWFPRRARIAGHVVLRAGIVALNCLVLFGYLLARYYR